MAYFLGLFVMMVGIAPAAAQSSPSTLEVFELRKKCNEQASLVMERQKKSLLEAMRKNGSPFKNISVTSNYDVKSFNCFALLSSSFERRAAEDWVFVESLYDALSNELLAFTVRLGNGNREGAVFDESNKISPSDERVGDVDSYIKKKMNTNR